jgi:acetone carboxylase gamma subunit
LAVEIVPPGYPLIFEFLPDIDRLYRDFLGKPLDDESGEWYQDRTAEKLASWS